MDSIIGNVDFSDGVTRPVYLDEESRQYVLDYDGVPVYRSWVYLDEQPDIVHRETPHFLTAVGG